MRREQLQHLVDRFREECGLSTRANNGVDHIATIKSLLRRTQEALYDEYDWPHLRRRFPAIALSAGQTKYDLPDTLDYTRVEKVVQWVDGSPYPLTRGIEIEDYETTDRYDVLSKYDFADDGDSEQVEVWPAPDRNDTTLQFQGIRKLRSFTDDDDTCDIDGLAIVLFAAADYLRGVKSPNAEDKLRAGQARVARLRQRAAENRPSVNLGGIKPAPENLTLKVRA